tara:strand:- start:58 stop:234 length:177 start_codon:yes stop_codon:yes gene_type:complete
MTRLEDILLSKRIKELENRARKEYLKYTDWVDVIAMLSEEDEKEYWNLMDKLYRGEEE